MMHFSTKYNFSKYNFSKHTWQDRVQIQRKERRDTHAPPTRARTHCAYKLMQIRRTSHSSIRSKNPFCPHTFTLELPPSFNVAFFFLVVNVSGAAKGPHSNRPPFLLLEQAFQAKPGWQFKGRGPQERGQGGAATSRGCRRRGGGRHSGVRVRQR